MKKILNIQTEIGTLSKKETNPFYKSKYFDINGLLLQLQPLLQKHSVTVMQPLSEINGEPALRTIVADTETGDIILDDKIPMAKNTDAQKMGSQITYYRRYALQSLFLLQAEDDDGNKGKPVVKKVLPKMTSDQELKAIEWIREGNDIKELAKKYLFNETELLNKVNNK